MKYRTFTRSSQQVSRLGFGAWGIGKKIWKGGDDAMSKRALHTAVDLGVTLFDSALVYGNGHSERLIGEVERESKKPLFLTSKIPSKKFEWPASADSTIEESYPASYIIEQTEKSLRHFGRDYLDLMQFHVWNDAWAGDDEWKEAVHRLKRSGKVRFWGISVNDHEPDNVLETLETGLIDSVQVIFNIFDQSPAERLFPYCQENNIAVIARVPFDEGGLTGAITPETTFPKKDWRNKYFQGERKQQVWERVNRIREEIGEECGSLAEAALRFVISFDAVTTVIPGMRREKHVQENVKSILKGPLSKALVERLKKHRWQRNFYHLTGST